MRIADSRVAGFYPLQHRGYDQKGFDLQLRGSIFGLRITDRYVGPDDFGEWEIDPDSVGDIHGGQLLKKNDRDVPMWRFATPMIVNPGSSKDNPPGTPVAAPGHGGGPAPTAGFVFQGINLNFSSGSPNAGISLDGQVPNFSSGSPQAGVSITEPLPPGSVGAAVGGGVGGGAPQPTPGANRGQGNKKCGTAPSSFEAFPIFDADFNPDRRLEPLSINQPKINGKKVWPKFPNSWVGLSLTANDERDQIDLFLPTDPRLVSVNFAGDKDMGSRVYDLDEKFNIDPDRGQALQSLTRVIKKPLGEPNALAWQLGPSGCEDTHGGYVIDNPTGGGTGGGGSGEGDGGIATPGPSSPSGGGGPASTDIPLSQFQLGGGAPGGGGGSGPGQTQLAEVGTGKVIARMSRNNGGPIDVGSGKCRHVLGRDGDGTPIVRGHIAHDFLLRQDDGKDGPLNISSWEPGDEANKKMKVKFGWNDGAKKWDWYTTTFLFFTPVTVPPPTPITPIPVSPIVPTIPPLTPVTSPVVSPISPVSPVPPEGLPIRTPSKQGKMGNSAIAGNTTNHGYLMTDQSMGLGEMLAKPYNFTADQDDSRYKKNGSEKGSNKRIDENPVTGSLSAFGAQGGSRNTSSVPSAPAPSPVTPPSPPAAPPAPPSPSAPGAISESALQQGATGDPWNFTHRPGRSRFRGGTANGGFVFLPPEVGMEMIEDGLVPKSNIDVSEAYFGVGPGAYFFAGIPELVSGRPKDGLSFGMDSDTGDLIFRAHYAGDAGVDAFRFDLDAQTFGFKARTNHYGNLRHFNDAERTYDFPNSSGLVLVGTSFPDMGGGSSATLGTIGGSGPGTASQAIWAAIDIWGATYYIPLWR